MPTRGTLLIAEERDRQIDVEKFSFQHDRRLHSDGSLVRAAICYATPEKDREYATLPDGSKIPVYWPWETGAWNPSPDNRVRELTIAGALIAAELDRLEGAKLCGEEE